MYSKSTIEKIENALHVKYKQGTSLKNIILNLPNEEHKHGCARKCPYCNWKDHPLAQSLIYPDFEELDKYLKDHTGLITISGGGDPLYNLNKNFAKIAVLLDHLYKKGLFVRVITRERENFFELRKVYPYLLGSFSIDSFKELKERDEFVEYSIVLNPDICKQIVTSRYKVLENHRIVLREPLNTGFKPSIGMLHLLSHYRYGEISTEKLCYEATYLVNNKVLTGYDIFD